MASQSTAATRATVAEPTNDGAFESEAYAVTAGATAQVENLGEQAKRPMDKNTTPPHLTQGTVRGGLSAAKVGELERKLGWATYATPTHVRARLGRRSADRLAD
jgi:hypothetical protein